MFVNASQIFLVYVQKAPNGADCGGYVIKFRWLCNSMSFIIFICVSCHTLLSLCCIAISLLNSAKPIDTTTNPPPHQRRFLRCWSQCRSESYFLNGSDKKIFETHVLLAFVRHLNRIPILTNFV